jgi:hypothetical protein
MRINEIKSKITGLTVDQTGHAVEKHTVMTDRELLERIMFEKLQVSSAFHDAEDVLELIKQVLLDEEYETPECIEEWLSDPSDGGLFVALKNFHRPVGRGYFREQWHEWSEGAVDCSEIEVVLEKIETVHDTTFKVVTAYPVATETDIQKFRNVSLAQIQMEKIG